MREFIQSETMFGWILWVREHPQGFQYPGFPTRTLSWDQCHSFHLPVMLMLWLVSLSDIKSTWGASSVIASQYTQVYSRHAIIKYKSLAEIGQLAKNSEVYCRLLLYDQGLLD